MTDRGVLTDPPPAGSPAAGSPAAEHSVLLTGVGKTFNAGRADQVTALAGVDLTVRRGQFVSLIGPSGCGKSTLLRLVADLVAPSTGMVTVAGKPARQARLDQEYGIVFQQAGLFDWRTVRRNVELPLELRGHGRRERRARAEQMLELVGLSDFAGHYPAQLSGGMQQRVAIARALAVHPPLLLMDEPFGALDEMTRERLQDELLGVCARTGTTTIFVTHSIPEAVYLSDRVVVMSARPGRIIAEVPIDLGRRRAAAAQAEPAAAGLEPAAAAQAEPAAAGPVQVTAEQTRQSAGFFAGITRVRKALRAEPLSVAGRA